MRPAGRHAALFELLDDESGHVWTEVRRRLGQADRSVEPTLRRLAEIDDARLRARARRVLSDRSRARSVRRLTGLALAPNVELETGLFVLSQLERSDFDARPYRKALDAMAREVASRARRAPDGLARPQVLAEYLGEELGYSGSTDDYHHPDNVFLHRTIERRAGMPLTLCALYQAVARRAGLRAALVPLPGHVLLRLYSGPDSALIDPFHGGEERTERECLRYLAQHGLSYRPGWFRDADDAAMFARQVANLRTSWMARGLGFEVRALNRVLEAMARNPAIPPALSGTS